MADADGADRLAEKLKAAGKFCSGGGLFTDADGVAYLLGYTTRTLRTWREKHYGPPWIPGRRVLYDIASLAEWIKSSEEVGSIGVTSKPAKRYSERSL